MKRIFTSFFCFSLIASSLFAQDTIVGWTFPSGNADSIVDFSISANSSCYISAQYGTYGLTSYHSILTYYTNGSQSAPDSAATSTGWNDGLDSSYWMVKCKTTGYENLKLYSKQSSGGSNPGPRDFKVQYKLSGTTTWVDIAGATVVCANNWTSGVVNGIDIPAACNNQASDVSFRWVMTSNFNISGGTVASTGIAKIDNIIITGTLLSGVESNIYNNLIQIFPNPNNGSFAINNINDITIIRILDITGKCVFEKENSFDNNINISGLGKGIYFIQLTTLNNKIFTSKIITE